MSKEEDLDKGKKPIKTKPSIYKSVTKTRPNFYSLWKAKEFHAAFASCMVTVFSSVKAAAHINLHGFLLYYTRKDFISLLHTPTVNEE